MPPRPQTRRARARVRRHPHLPPDGRGARGRRVRDPRLPRLDVRLRIPEIARRVESDRRGARSDRAPRGRRHEERRDGIRCNLRNAASRRTQCGGRARGRCHIRGYSSSSSSRGMGDRAQTRVRADRARPQTVPRHRRCELPGARHRGAQHRRHPNPVRLSGRPSSSSSSSTAGHRRSERRSHGLRPVCQRRSLSRSLPREYGERTLARERAHRRAQRRAARRTKRPERLVYRQAASRSERRWLGDDRHGFGVRRLRRSESILLRGESESRRAICRNTRPTPLPASAARRGASWGRGERK